MITSLAFRFRKFTFITPTQFDQNLVVFPKLLELDLLRLQNNLNDHALSKILNACLKSLKVFKLGYGTTSQSLGLGSLSTVALAKCKLLKKL